MTDDKMEQTYDVILVCKNCGAEHHAKGHTIAHKKAGTMSFLAYNVNSRCIYCHPDYAKYRKEK